MFFEEVVSDSAESRMFGGCVVLAGRRMCNFVGDGSIIASAPARGRVRGDIAGCVLLRLTSTSKTC